MALPEQKQQLFLFILLTTLFIHKLYIKQKLFFALWYNKCNKIMRELFMNKTLVKYPFLT